MRRKRIDDWQIKHDTKKFTRRLTQLTYQAAKRQAKQTIRDNRRQYEIGAKVKVQGVRRHGTIADVDWDSDDPMIYVRFQDFTPVAQWYPVDQVKVKS